METVIILADDPATRALGAAISGVLRAGDVIALHGDLGAGKTTLMRGLVQALCGADEEVPSPTYTLVQAYDAPDFSLWHFDLYRLDRPEDVHELGWDETQDGVAVIEWPERAGRYLPTTRLDLTLEMLGAQRRARLEPVGEDWQKRLDGFRF
jgi:tRNA threonylcarbamoyladenosine biosynthesis protein TsaE